MRQRTHGINMKFLVISPAEKATVAVTRSQNSLKPGVTEVGNTFHCIGQAVLLY